MDLNNFLQIVSDPKSILKYTIVYIRAELPSALFFSLLSTHLKKHVYLTTLDLEIITLDALKAQCAISFLGNQVVYWLKNIELLSTADQTMWLEYIYTYTGPHVLCVASHVLPKRQPNEHMLLVEFPSYINQDDYRILYQKYMPFLGDESFVKKLFNKQSMISLDQASMMLYYHVLVGSKNQAFFTSWFDMIITPDKSLFTLSQLLFAAHNQEFWKYWITSKNQYSEEFWIVFWSEQLWQASLFVSIASTKNTAEAKKVVTRLPFSFINKDWRRYTPEFLAQAHHFLTTVDYNSKNNSNAYGLELCLHKFLLGNFEAL